MENDIVSPSK